MVVVESLVRRHSESFVGYRTQSSSRINTRACKTNAATSMFQLSFYSNNPCLNRALL